MASTSTSSDTDAASDLLILVESSDAIESVMVDVGDADVLEDWIVVERVEKVAK